MWSSKRSGRDESALGRHIGTSADSPTRCGHPAPRRRKHRCGGCRSGRIVGVTGSPRASGPRRWRDERSRTMSDEELVKNVTDELSWDPKVDHLAIAVAADDGVVTLRGTVGSFRQKREAKKDAERIYGVRDVKDELQVRILTDGGKDDAE